MDPRAFQTLAAYLVASKGGDAASIRTAIGRAYYASYHVASEAIKGLGFPPIRHTNAHQMVAQLLQNSGDNEVEPLGGMLGDLHARRVLADYQLDKPDVETLKSGRLGSRRPFSSSMGWNVPGRRSQEISDACYFECALQADHWQGALETLTK